MLNLKKEFFDLSKDEQEEESIRIANEYYKLAEKWRRISVKIRVGTFKKEDLVASKSI